MSTTGAPVDIDAPLPLRNVPARERRDVVPVSASELDTLRDCVAATIADLCYRYQPGYHSAAGSAASFDGWIVETLAQPMSPLDRQRLAAARTAYDLVGRLTKDRLCFGMSGGADA